MIRADNISHNYGDNKALDGFNLSVEQGEIYGLIGPDAAGKTTFIRLLTTLLDLQEGQLSVNNTTVNDIRQIRAMIGYMPQRFSLYPDLSVRENLSFYADIFAVPAGLRDKRLKELYRFSRLQPFADRPAGKLSGGMKQKLALMCALIHEPPVLVLDEPTTGVDPLSREEFWQTLFDIRAKGHTILVSTPYMDEAEKCDHLTLIHKGRSIANGTPASVIAGAGFGVLQTAWLRQTRVEECQTIPGVLGLYPFGQHFHIHIDTKQKSGVQKALSGALGNGYSLKNITPELEDVFIHKMAAT
jgi:ABC-2 type transport system ATP-binding protein